MKCGVYHSFNLMHRVLIVIDTLFATMYLFFKGMPKGNRTSETERLGRGIYVQVYVSKSKCGKTPGTILYRQIEYTKQCFACR